MKGENGTAVSSYGWASHPKNTIHPTRRFVKFFINPIALLSFD